MYHVIGRDGQQYGPIDENTMRDWLGKRLVDVSSLSVYDGEDCWRPLRERGEFSDCVTDSRVLPPPPPPSRVPASPVRRIGRWQALVFGVLLLGSTLVVLAYWALYRLPPYFTDVEVTGTVARLSGHYNYSNDLETDARKLHGDLWLLATRRRSVTHLYLHVYFYGTDEYGNPATQDLGVLEIVDVSEIRKYRSLPVFLNADRFKIEVVDFLMTSRSSPYRRF